MKTTMIIKNEYLNEIQKQLSLCNVNEASCIRVLSNCIKFQDSPTLEIKKEIITDRESMRAQALSLLLYSYSTGDFTNAAFVQRLYALDELTNQFYPNEKALNIYNNMMGKK